MQSRVEFIGGPKDGEVIYSRSEFLSKHWYRPVLSEHEVDFSPETEFYLYLLEATELHNERNYIYQGTVTKDQLV